MSKPTDVTKSDFKSTVLDSKIPVLVDFWAPWCRPCQMMAPVLDDVAESHEGKLKVVKVDIENSDNLELARQYEIMNIPNMKVFKGGKVVHEIIGFRDKNTLVSELDEAIGIA